MELKKQLIVILGPTASGKSELAIFLAKQIKKHQGDSYKEAEIISADSRQVYKYLDVGTNKVPGTWQTIGGFASDKKSEAKPPIVFIYKNIPHYCIDFVHPRKTYTVAEYKTCAEKAIKEISRRGNIPLLVGGTGLYIQAVTDGMLLPEVPPNVALRKKLEKKPTEQLFAILKKLDPRRALTIDAKNPRRLIRALEIVLFTQKSVPKLKIKSEFETLFIGIKKSDTELKHAIEQRSKKQITGLLKEAELLLKIHVPKKRIRELGFEYRLGLEFLTRKKSLPTSLLQREEFPHLEKRGAGRFNDLIMDLSKENWRYTRRQMTWFKRNKQIQWIQKNDKALYIMKKFLGENK
ncbi:MAG: hypothetical protein A3J54_04275 [Candidatus Ryanbacteria bacterium RIFCSPHIGHO2_02_FULL_45_13b]|nr:MAG: hypothetical protein A3J54_04275 [Candidatus Ryanbacteria bacterium RIFCSPHIGHO2_02_FULL_45_13b]